MRLNWLSMTYSPYEGYGRHARYMTRELLALGVDAVPVAHDAADWLRRSGTPLQGITIQLCTHNKLLRLPGRQWAYTMYETTRPPQTMIDHLNQWFERVLTPSTWGAQMFRAAGVTVPVHVVPEGIDADEFPLLPETSIKPHDPFVFLAPGSDRGRRKGYGLTYQAFYEAFGERRGVELVFKARENRMDHLTFQEPNIRLWREDVTHLDEVYRRADCYVFPSFGEGWGLPPREAVAMGVPSIVAANSGLLDGIDHYATVKLERYRCVASDMDGGGEWHKHDAAELADAMRWVYDHYEEAKERAFKGAAWLRAHQSWEHAARALVALLEEVG